MISAVTADPGIEHPARSHMLLPHLVVEPFGQGVAEKQDAVRLGFGRSVDLLEAGAGMAVLPRRRRGQLALHERAAPQWRLRLGQRRVAVQRRGY